MWPVACGGASSNLGSGVSLPFSSYRCLPGICVTDLQAFEEGNRADIFRDAIHCCLPLLRLQRPGAAVCHDDLLALLLDGDESHRTSFDVRWILSNQGLESCELLSSQRCGGYRQLQIRTVDTVDTTARLLLTLGLSQLITGM